jgi:hypothetical protein
VKFHLIWIIILLVYIVSCAKDDPQSKLKEHDLNLPISSSFKIVQISKSPIIFSAEDSIENNFIKIKITPLSKSQRAMDEVKNQVLRTISNYSFSSAPYPGQLTQIINCGKRKKPKLQHFGNFSLMVLYARDRFGLSICDSDSFSHMSYTSFYLDEKLNRMIEIEYRQNFRNRSDQYFKFFNRNFLNLKPISLRSIDALFNF